MAIWKVLYIGKKEHLPEWLYHLVANSSEFVSVDSVEKGIEKLRKEKFDLLIIGLERFHDAVEHRIREIALESNPDIDIIYNKMLSSSFAPMGFYCNASRLEQIVMNSRFWGISEAHDFLSLVEGIGMTSRTASLTIISGMETGIVYFKDGKVLHAEVGEFKGRQAFFKMMAWKGGVYFVEEGVEPSEITIDERVDSLLLSIISSFEEDKNYYDQFLNVILMELPGKVHWGAVIKDGEIISSLGEHDKSIIDFVRCYSRSFRKLIGGIEHMNIEFEGFWVSVRKILDDVYVVVVFEGNPFIVDYVLAQNIKSYAINTIEEKGTESAPMEFSFEKFEKSG